MTFLYQPMLQIIQHEIKLAIKPTLIWLFGINAMQAGIILIFPQIAKQQDALNSVLANFDPALYKAFGVDPQTIGSFAGYYVSQFISLYLLIGATYFAYRTYRSLGHPFHSKEIVFMLTKPYSRLTVWLAKYIQLSIQNLVASIGIALAAFLIAQTIPSAQQLPQLAWSVAITILLFQQLIISLSMLFSIYLHAGGAILVAAAFSISGFIINGLAALQGAPSELKYLSIFYYLDLIAISSQRALGQTPLVVVLFCLVVSLFAYLLWQKREIHV